MSRPKSAMVAIALVLLVVLTVVPNRSFFAHSNPSTLLVPQDYLTIQLAINAASPGDTVMVSAGVYNGNITIGKSLILMGVSATSVIVNASNLAPGITVNATSAVSISQLTIEDPDTVSSAVKIVSSYNIV